METLTQCQSATCTPPTLVEALVSVPPPEIFRCTFPAQSSSDTCLITHNIRRRKLNQGLGLVLATGTSIFVSCPLVSLSRAPSARICEPAEHVRDERILWFSVMLPSASLFSTFWSLLLYLLIWLLPYYLIFLWSALPPPYSFKEHGQEGNCIKKVLRLSVQ